MFGSTRRIAKLACRGNWSQRERNRNVLLLAASVAGATILYDDKPTNTTRERCGHTQSLFQGLVSLAHLSPKTFCESAVQELHHKDDDAEEGEVINEEEEQFLDTLALYRRWLADIKKQWEISSPASTQWPTNIPQKNDISALEMDLQLYLKGGQADTRRCQDLQFRIASYYLFREKSLEQQKKGFNMVKELAVVGHPDGLCLYGTNRSLLPNYDVVIVSSYYSFFL